MTGGNGTDRARSAALGRRRGGGGRQPGGMGLDLQLGATKPAALHDRDRLDRLRRRRLVVLLLADARWTATGHDHGRRRRRRRSTGERLVRPPVGRLHHGRWRRLGLVRGQSRRRHRPDAVARSRTPTARTRSSTGRSSRRRHDPAPAARRRSRVEVTKRWTSPATGADYPAGWRVTIPGESLVIDLTPTVAAQELDTRATTGVVYWEGSQRVSATRDGRPLGGEAYVELTGYAAGRRGG